MDGFTIGGGFLPPSVAEHMWAASRKFQKPLKSPKMNRDEHKKSTIKPDPEKYCEYCGKRMHRVRFESGRLEDLTAFIRRKYCCRECMKKAFVKVGDKEQGYSAAHHSARKLAYLILNRECCCERCGSKKNIDVHHKDRNRNNNTPNNLELLCRSCHMKEHSNNLNTQK